MLMRMRGWRHVLPAVLSWLAACHDTGTSPVQSPQAIVVDISGLPAGISANITLTSPDGASTRVTESARIGTSVTGSWRLVSGPVSSTSSTWIPSVARIDSALTAGETLHYSVAYTRTGNAFTALIAGLPSGSDGSLTVRGPDSSRRTVVRDTILLALDSGTYLVRADTVLVNGLRYAPSPVMHLVPVSSSLATTSITVTYRRALPVLDVRVTGLPPGTPATLRIENATGMRTVAASNLQTLVTAPGSVSVTALDANDALGHAYAADASPMVRNLADGSHDSVNVHYSRTHGTLLTSSRGLPQGTEAAITLTGNAYSAGISGLSALDLTPGQYVLRAFPVTVGSTRYVPQPSTATITVEKGANVSATVLYASGNAPAFNAEVDAAYITQVVQQPDGSLPLVAGRDALLRVFAHANFSNNASVPVRARLYRSGTLVATLDLTALPAIPTTINEGTLSASWNILVPAARMEPGLGVVVELDPANTLGETTRDDNRWPRNGVPQPIDVRNVPPLAVRFVPIVINAIPGAVTAADRDSYLTLAKRLHPLLEVSSDVHAPFVSSVRNPLLVDGLTLWGSLLSELEALRVAEGATVNYFGVVNSFFSKGIAGIALTGGPVAVGYDQPERRALTVAHELGHNFGRMHAPCGNPSLPDPHYPYTGGLTGAWGWNALTNELVSPRSTDLMAYCDDVWMSGWTWSNEFTFREHAAFNAQAARMPMKTRAAGRDNALSSDGLLVWGRIVDGEITIEPAFRLRAPLTATSASVSHRLDVVDDHGVVIASRSVLTSTAADVDGHELHTFALVIPWNDSLETRAIAIRIRSIANPLSARERRAARATSSGSGAPGDVGLGFAPSSTQRILVRDRATGQLLGFFNDALPVSLIRRQNIEAISSDGVHSRLLRAP